MDCGPVALWSLLTGLGVEVPYDSLREACRTGVDGTSIRALEAVLRHFGLSTQQIVAPKEHLGHPAANLLPAIAVTRQSGGAMHFVLLWRRRRGRIEVMDPASGRRLLTPKQLFQELYEHPLEVEAEVWRQLALSKTAQAVLATRLKHLGVTHAERLLNQCSADPSWRAIGALDAAARLVEGLVQGRALPRGAQAAALCERLFQAGCQWQPGQALPIPGACWSALTANDAAGPTSRVRTRGALLLHVGGWLAKGVANPTVATPQSGNSGTPEASTGQLAALRQLSPGQRGPSLASRLWSLLGSRDRAQVPAFLLWSALAGLLVLTQALFLRALLDLPGWLVLWPQRLVAGLLLVLLSSLVLALDLGLTGRALQLGRSLEARLRSAVQSGLPRLPGRWFGTRPASDLAERAHSLGFLHEIPLLSARIVRCGATMLFTAIGLLLLDPGRAPGVLLLLLAALAVPFYFSRGLNEKELRVRGHQGALVRFYWEALSGLVAVRVHGAERALRQEHESLLVEWAHAGQALARAGLLLKALSGGILTLLALLLVGWHLSSLGAQPAALLFGYWALALPALGEQLAQAALLAAPMGNAARRALEPIEARLEAEPAAAKQRALTPDSALGTHAATGSSATSSNAEARAVGPESTHFTPSTHLAGWPEDTAHWRAAGAAAERPPQAEIAAAAPSSHLRLVREPQVDSPGLDVELRGVSLELGGRRVLEALNLHLLPGEHLALLGRSGAGKSSLLSLLLGLEQPAAGSVLIDGETLNAADGEGERPESNLARLRRHTAWVDPAVQLWNQSAFENLIYGREAVNPEELVAALEAMDATELVARLPEGLSTVLGEGGLRLSGGEGQRLRLARAWLKDHARLVLLDEPFRGLERSRRALLMERLRQRFAQATLIAVTHDVESALAFPRVAILEGGRLVEQGRPAELAARPDSALAELLAAERRLRSLGFGDLGWRRFWVADGHLEERR
jgi:ABC-type bacteriocin/lantibiotic exporter with double-glycine peptidase domain